MPRKSAVSGLSEERIVYRPVTTGELRLTLLITSEPQYKYQINKKWHLRKNIPTSKKVAMNHRYQDLSTAGKAAVIRYKGQEVDPRKLRRQAKMETRRTLVGGRAQATGPEDTAFLSPLASPAAKL